MYNVKLENYTNKYRFHPCMNTLHTIKEKKANWTGHILHRNCLLDLFIKGKIGEGEK